MARQKFKKIIEKARKHRFGAFHPNFHVDSIIKVSLVSIILKVVQWEKIQRKLNGTVWNSRT